MQRSSRARSHNSHFPCLLHFPIRKMIFFSGSDSVDVGISERDGEKEEKRHGRGSSDVIRSVEGPRDPRSIRALGLILD